MTAFSASVSIRSSKRYFMLLAHWIIPVHQVRWDAFKFSLRYTEGCVGNAMSIVDHEFCHTSKNGETPLPNHADDGLFSARRLLLAEGSCVHQASRS